MKNSNVEPIITSYEKTMDDYDNIDKAVKSLDNLIEYFENFFDHKYPGFSSDNY